MFIMFYTDFFMLFLLYNIDDKTSNPNHKGFTLL